MTEAAPLVSVVLPTHDRPELLREAVGSLVDQTFPDWEAIVVDDGSTPAVRIEALTAAPRKRLQRHEIAQGGAAAKNTGIRLARGSLIACLDDDDLFAPQYLARAVDVLARHPDLDGTFMNVCWFGDRLPSVKAESERAVSLALAFARGVEREQGLLVFGEDLFTALLHTVPMAFQRAVVRRSALERIGLYEPHCLLWDCDWAIRATAKCRFGLVLDPLYRQRAQGQGTSSQPHRKLEHMMSRAEILDRLRTNAVAYGLNEVQCHQARQSAAAAWFCIAYFHCTEHHAPMQALFAWMKSQRRQLSLRRLKFLGRLLHTGLYANRARQRTAIDPL